MKTRVTELLGIEHPIIQGGMAWVAEYHLAAAVSEAGGLGLIGGANAPGEVIRDYIRKAKERTSKPFGVNVMLMSPYADDVAKVVVEEGIKVVTTGAGNPGKYMDMWKAAGIKVIPVVASVALAKMMEKAGADAVVAEGTESGGHIGEATTMTLVPQVVDAVNIPVIAAGGIADGRGIAAAFMLGAEAVQIGTRFVVAKESIVHENYKQRIIKAKDIDSTVTGRSHGHPVRCLRNQMTREYNKLESEGKSFEELEYLTLGTLRKAVQEGDVTHGTVMAGQIAGMIDKEQTCKEMIDEISTLLFVLGNGQQIFHQQRFVAGRGDLRDEDYIVLICGRLGFIGQIGVDRVTHLMHEREHIVERAFEIQEHKGMHARARRIRTRALALIFVYINPAIVETFAQQVQIILSKGRQRFERDLLGFVKGEFHLYALDHRDVQIIHVQCKRAVHCVDQVVVDRRINFGAVERGGKRRRIFAGI